MLRYIDYTRSQIGGRGGGRTQGKKCTQGVRNKGSLTGISLSLLRSYRPS